MHHRTAHHEEDYSSKNQWADDQEDYVDILQHGAHVGLFEDMRRRHSAHFLPDQQFRFLLRPHEELTFFEERALHEEGGEAARRRAGAAPTTAAPPHEQVVDKSTAERTVTQTPRGGPPDSTSSQDQVDKNPHPKGPALEGMFSAMTPAGKAGDVEFEVFAPHRQHHPLNKPKVGESGAFRLHPRHPPRHSPVGSGPDPIAELSQHHPDRPGPHDTPEHTPQEFYPHFTPPRITQRGRNLHPGRESIGVACLTHLWGAMWAGVGDDDG